MNNLLSAAQIAALSSADFEALKNAFIEAERLQSEKALNERARESAQQLIERIQSALSNTDFSKDSYLTILHNELAQYAPQRNRRTSASAGRNTTGNLLLSAQTTYKPFKSLSQATPGTVPGDVLHIIQKSDNGITFDDIVTELRNMPQHSGKSEYNVRQSVRESIWKLKNFLTFDATGAQYRFTTT